MKSTFLFIVIISFFISCSSSNKEDVIANASTSMSIEGMTCAEMCAKRIEDKITRTKGVKSCSIDFDNKLANIQYNDTKVELDNIVKMIEKMEDNKYKVSDIKTNKINTSVKEINSSNEESESDQIMSTPSFELPNLANYFRDII